MAQTSAGILLYRLLPSGRQVLLVHPGGPFWAKRDEAAWSVPKGLCEPGEDPEHAARREFQEETGAEISAALTSLGAFRQPGGKTILVWAAEGDFEPATLKSNLFTMEWPPRSGRIAEFPEVDRADWFGLEEARRKLHKGQLPILDALRAHLRETRQEPYP